MRAEDIARNIKLIILDVDGVLTDGGIYYDHEGHISKRFNVQDGLGIKLAQSTGLEISVITGLDNEAVRTRITELGITDYYPGNPRKVPFFEKLLVMKNLSPEQVAYVGDDWVDAAVMKRVGLPMAVSNAQPEIKGLARWISSRKGGNGAVREALSFIMQCQGTLEKVWKEWAF
ncbi:KdsC family phosphatase [Maridesulfovibrio bastinii]|uniref:KdsC family phosphatase n=1 Tax=Maridesulfovibrio bastinii TaxID=47157 RepID=UPI0003F94B65|nr:HAD-IIIA family hydrolase [Maridesulfovibrio bastinii]